MHDTVNKVRKRILNEEPAEQAAALFSARFTDAGLSRALGEPLAAHLELLYLEAHRWLRAAFRLEGGTGEAELLAELMFASRNIREILDDLLPFLERAEDSLGERDDITHRESGYEREVAPFSRLDSTHALRDVLGAHAAFSGELATIGAQIEADLMKVVYLERRLADQVPKPSDLFAMVVELGLDGRRHIAPNLEESSTFLSALTRAAQGS